MNITLTNLTEDSELKVANAGGISHDNHIESLEEARELNEKLISWGHMSPIEFGVAGFKVEDASRSFLAQITRHRMASFMVKSQRYVNHSDMNLVLPKSIEEWLEEDSVNRDTFDQIFNGTKWIYDKMVEDGVPKEDARFMLPIGTATDIYIQTNFREWRHIIKLRGTPEAQWEIREFANEVLDVLYNKAPSIFKDLYEQKRK